MKHSYNGSSEGSDALYIAGGLALIAVGAGLIISRPVIRQTISTAVADLLPDLQGKLGLDFSGIGSDIQRYLKLKNM